MYNDDAYTHVFKLCICSKTSVIVMIIMNYIQSYNFKFNFRQ